MKIYFRIMRGAQVDGEVLVTNLSLRRSFFGKIARARAGRCTCCEIGFGKRQMLLKGKCCESKRHERPGNQVHCRTCRRVPRL